MTTKTVFKNADTYVAGDDVVLERLVFNDDLGNPINVGGDTLVVTIKSSLDVSDSEAEMQVVRIIESGELAEHGIVDVHVTSEETNFSSGDYNYDIKWIRTQSGAGEKHTLQYGRIKFVQGVTQI